MAGITLFGSLNTSLLGIYTHKLAMNVVSHNIANANTEGFSRQRPIIETTPPIPIATLTQPSLPMVIGTGSQVRDIQRVRDLFLDIQYRQVENRFSFWDTTISNLHFVEQLFSEPGDTGIRSLYDAFLSSVEEVITDPTNVAAKREMISTAEQLVANTKDLYSRLQQLRRDLDQEVLQIAERINSLVSQLANINEQVRISSALKVTPNDLLDERDRILDELSKYSNVSFTETSDGQTIVMLGDQVVLSGSVQTPVRAEKRPYAENFHELFAGNSKLTINDGKLRALMDLRDITIVKYMGYLDEFSLMLSDKVNLIHRDGFDSSGTVTGLNFFVPISAQYSGEDPALFRVLGSRQMEAGPIHRVTGLNNYENIPDIVNKRFVDDGRLIFFNGSDSFSDIFMNAGDTINDLITSVNSSVSWLNMGVGQHMTSNGVKYRLYMEENTLPISDTLVIDASGTLLSEAGFQTEEKAFLSIENILNVENGSYRLTFNETLIDGTTVSEAVDIDVDTSSATILNDVANAINTQVTNVQAKVIGGSIVLVPVKNMAFDINRLEIEDEEGFLTQADATTKSFTVLKSSETLENIFFGATNFDETQGFKITIGSTDINVDPTVDTLKDFAEKINKSNTGVLADLTPHNSFVLYSTRSYDFNLRFRKISGPQGLFEGLGFIDTNSDPLDFDADWSVSYDLIDPSEDFATLRSKLSLSELLTVDKKFTYEPFYFVDQWAVSSALSMNAESLAVDIGQSSANSNWNALSISATGRSNTKILDLISQSRYEKLLADGKESFFEYIGGIIAEMGVEAETANKMRDNSDVLLRDINSERERVKGVSLDEEMANMLKYQHAFDASARVMTAIDEMIGRVIDNLGVVGR